MWLRWKWRFEVRISTLEHYTKPLLYKSLNLFRGDASSSMFIVSSVTEVVNSGSRDILISGIRIRKSATAVAEYLDQAPGIIGPLKILLEKR